MPGVRKPLVFHAMQPEKHGPGCWSQVGHEGCSVILLPSQEVALRALRDHSTKKPWRWREEWANIQHDDETDKLMEVLTWVLSDLLTAKWRELEDPALAASHRNNATDLLAYLMIEELGVVWDSSSQVEQKAADPAIWVGNHAP